MKVATIFLLVCLFLGACTLGGSPKIINHEKPDMQVDYSPFNGVGCISTSYGWYKCGKQSLLYELGCLHIAKDELLGGFTPLYPIARCGYFFNEVDGTEAIDSSIDLSVECFSYTVTIDGTSCGRFVIFKDGNYLLVKNFDKLRALFAPVDSPQEALSFALATSNYSAQYGQTKNSKYVYSVSEVEDTFVETIADGYLVHLFYTPSVGCGPFNTEAVEVKVTFDGYIQEMNRYPIYRDPSNDDLCAD
jgi:hypothetical protein